MFYLVMCSRNNKAESISLVSAKSKQEACLFAAKETRKEQSLPPGIHLNTEILFDTQHRDEGERFHKNLMIAIEEHSAARNIAAKTE